MNVLAQVGVVANFTDDTFVVSLLKAVAILLFLLLSVLFALWFERRLVARFQQRLGPNVRGPFGLAQSLPDALKLLLKEDITVKAADKVIYLIAPVISVVTAFLVFAVIPFGPNVDIGSISTPLQLTDMPVSVLYILGVTAIGVYGIVLGGWASGSTYPLLGSVRSTAQVISYELGMGLALVSVFIMSGTMSTSGIVHAQTGGAGGAWWAFSPLLVAFVVYVISMVGETNRLPFDLPEAEGELVGGFNTEYSSMKFAWFFLAEYINMLNVSAVATTLFLGGWTAPFPFNYISALDPTVAGQGWWGVLWFLLKVWTLMGVFVWIRGTLLRFRYDQFMNLGWKVLIPVALVSVVGIALFKAGMTFGWAPFSTLSSLRAWFVAIMVLVIIASISWFFVGTRRDVAQTRAKEDHEILAKKATEPFEPFAGGYPVPPLPGQQLPPSTRRARVTAPAAAPTKESEDA